MLVPAPWTDTIEELCAKGVTGETYAHEVIKVPAGTAWDVLERVREEAVPVHDDVRLVARRGVGHGHVQRLGGPAAVGHPELGAVGRVRGGPAHRRRHPAVAGRAHGARSEQWDRFLLVDAPLSPLRTGRQPLESDRDSYQLPD